MVDEVAYVSEYQDPAQLRSTSNTRRDPRSSLQFVRKLSGFARPSKANEAAFNRAVDQVTEVVHDLLATLVTNAPPRDREIEAAKAKARSAERYGGSGA